MQARTIAAAAAFAAGLIAAAAAAEPAGPTLRVSYADLNLASPRDAAVMIGRIRTASARVCAAVPGSSGTSIGAIEQFDACYRQAVAGAVRVLAAPAVTQAYNRTGGDSRLASR